MYGHGVFPHDLAMRQKALLYKGNMWNSLEIVLVRMSEKLSKKQWEMKNCQVGI